MLPLALRGRLVVHSRVNRYPKVVRWIHEGADMDVLKGGRVQIVYAHEVRGRGYRESRG